MRRLRIGILGAARITELALVTPARATGDELVAVAARDRTRAEAAADRHGIARVHDDYAGVIADPDVDVVYNPLANSLHGPWNLAAVRAGKHVLSEKPFAANAAEARAIAEAAERAGVAVVEAFHYLHHPVMRRMLQLVGDGELGELRSVEAHVTMPAPPEDDPRWSFELAGGAVMDLGCYGLHALRMLAPFPGAAPSTGGTPSAGGAPSVGWARAGERAGRPGVDEWLEAELDYPGGARGYLRCSMNDDWLITLRVVGETGEACAANFVLPHRDDRIAVRTRATGVRTERPGRRSSYLYQLEALRSHLLDGTPFPLDAADAQANAELVDAVYLAAGLPVRPATHTSEVTG